MCAGREEEAQTDFDQSMRWHSRAKGGDRQMDGDESGR